MKKLLLALTVLAAAATPAFADPDDDKLMAKLCKVSRAQAHAIALSKVPGTVTDTDVELTLTGKRYWKVEVTPNNGIKREVHIDGKTGAVMKIEVDD